MTGSFQPYNADQQANAGNDLEPPADGTYTGCLLRDASAFTAKSGKDFVKLEWQTADGYRWTVLQGFKSDEQAAITWSEIGKLGINPVDIASLEALNDAVVSHINEYFDVVVKTNGQFRNTYINGPSVGAGQEQLAVNGGQQPAAVGAGDSVADDDIPF